MVPIYHYPGCGGVAFYYTEVPATWEPLIPTKVVTVQGARPTAGRPVLCGKCGKHIGQSDVFWWPFYFRKESSDADEAAG